MWEENSIEEIFYHYLTKLKVIKKANLSHCMTCGIYGTTYGKYEENYILNDMTEIEELSNFIFIDKISASSYGFIESKDEVSPDQFIKFGKLWTGYEGDFKVTNLSVQPFSNRVNLEYCLNNNADEIYQASINHLLYLELEVYGCFKDLNFWRKILYQSYMLYKAGDVTGSFINMFISFESMLREVTDLGEESKLNEIYATYTNSIEQLLPKELHAYRLIRNELLHGEDDLARYLVEYDLLLLLMNIRSLYEYKEPYKGEETKIKKTKAIKKALNKEYKKKK
ncbi:hypothetical protein LG296_20820 (plasmid) [Ureibacillus chungkukjangi]|uniref:hypothetical protein n=1 Tax=Ureibacillus chungkukjangi TaxID=1202712 RepID=UPI000D3BAAFA|nr:hypothetical protein [Ureibacillus chungkukjangi]MCM3389998.1 hypothetical protein [Ureibacillus chungkukjangi]